MAGIVNDTKKTTQQIAQKVAQQIAQEPVEILKQAATQISGVESEVKNENPNAPKENSQNIPSTNETQLKEKLKVQGQRQLQALETEIKEIRQQKEQKETVEEQQEVIQKQQAEQIETPAPQISSKPSRKFMGGQKQAAQRETTRVEKPLPPSG